MLNRQAISVLLFGAVLASAAVPQISHVFSARIKVRDDYPVEGNTLNWHYTVRAINRTKVMLEGILPSQYPGNMKMIYVAPKHYTLIQPFFDRTTCVTLPAVMPIVAFDVDSFAVFNGTYPCPNHPARMCDKWWSEEGYLKNSFFLFKDTAIPALLEQLIITSDGVIQNNDTFSFEWFSASTPDDHYFEIPSSLNCNDYSTKDNTSASAPRFALSRFGLGRAVPLESAKELVNDPANIARIASEVSTWTPAASSRFNGMTFADARKLTTWPSFKPRLPFASLGKPAQVRNAHLPASFDWRVQNPACVGGFDDQDYCGGCWAFGAVEAVADRICIQSHNNVSVPLSVQHMLSCTSGCYGCDGGYVDVAWRHLVDGGVPTASCIAFQGWQTDACPSQCDDGSDASENFVHLSSAYDVYDHHPAQNVKEIQKEIMRHGPVEAGFWAFDDFYNYKSGIYTRSASAKFAGGHAVKVLGWGEENGIPYWICANSWGASWGESGTFRIKRGVNECMIEQQVAAGMAAL